MRVILRMLAFIVVSPILLILVVSELLGLFVVAAMEYAFTGEWNWES